MKSKRVFFRALIIYCLVLVALICAGLFILNRYLVSYEASRSDNVVEEFVNSKDRSFWLNSLQHVIEHELNEFTKTDAPLSDFGIDEDAGIIWRSRGGEDQTKKYDIYLGSSQICSLTLKPGGDVGFGLSSWTVSDLSFNIPGGSKIIISVPSGSTATINGVEVSNSYIKSIGSMEISLDHSFDIAPAADFYEINDMKGPADIKAFAPNGKELSAFSVSASHAAFVSIPQHSFNFCTLPDAKVYVNGTELSGEYCSAVDFGLDSDINSSIVRYECSGLYTQPQISVFNGEDALKPLDFSIGKCYIPGASKAIDGDMASFLEGFIYAYVNFSVNKNDTAMTNFQDLAAYLLPGSYLYDLSSKTIENISWEKTSELKYNSIDYFDLIPLGENKYVCSISYNLSYSTDSGDFTVDTGNYVLIEQHEGKYYVSAMSAAIE